MYIKTKNSPYTLHNTTFNLKFILLICRTKLDPKIFIFSRLMMEENGDGGGKLGMEGHDISFSDEGLNNLMVTKTSAVPKKDFRYILI